MSSLVIYGNEFNGHLESGLAPEQFTYRILVEGDSWMDRSAMFDTSLLQKLVPAMDEQDVSVLFISVAMFGDTIRRMGQKSGDFRQWVRTDFGWKFDAILLSAGGNDFIDAARNPPPGLGILKDMAGQALPAQGRDCLKAAAVSALTNQWLNPGFAAVYGLIQSSRHQDVPVFLNSYDTPTARNAPAFKGGRSWLCESYVNNHIDPTLWPDLTAAIFAEVKATMAGWAANRANVHVVPTNGTLDCAEPGTTGSDHDWLNEIHPNAGGWQKLAAVWRASLLQVLT